MGFGLGESHMSESDCCCRCYMARHQYVRYMRDILYHLKECALS